MADFGRTANAGPLGPVEGEPEREKGFRRCDMVREGSILRHPEAVRSVESELCVGKSLLMCCTARKAGGDGRKVVGDYGDVLLWQKRDAMKQN